MCCCSQACSVTLSVGWVRNPWADHGLVDIMLPEGTDSVAWWHRCTAVCVWRCGSRTQSVRRIRSGVEECASSGASATWKPMHLSAAEGSGRLVWYEICMNEHAQLWHGKLSPLTYCGVGGDSVGRGRGDHLARTNQEAVRLIPDRRVFYALSLVTRGVSRPVHLHLQSNKLAAGTQN